MKVLIVSSMYPRHENNLHAGFIHRQSIELSKYGVTVRVICPVSIFRGTSSILIDIKNVFRTAKTVNMDNIPVTYLPYWNTPHRFSVRMEIAAHYRSLYNYVRSIRSDFNFDLIHAHRLFPTGYVAMLIAHQLGVPFVASARGSDVHTSPLRNNGIARYTRATIRMSNQILSVSGALARQINSLTKSAAPVRVIYNGVDYDKFKPIQDHRSLRKRLGLPEDGVGFCTVCRLVKEKGLVELLKAFEEITCQFPNVWLAIVGNGSLRGSLEHFVKERSMENKVYFVGSRPHNEIRDWMNASDIFALASYNEGLPNVLLEAMACALPVVVTNVGGVPEAAIDKTSAFIVPPRQVKPLVEAFSKLIQNPELRIQMGNAGFDIVSQEFQWSQSAQSLVDVYSKLTGTKWSKKAKLYKQNQSAYTRSV